MTTTTDGPGRDAEIAEPGANPGEVRIPHVAALDGLRGAAVAAVVLFHGGHLRGGYLGVDLFFVLSGFLITSLLLAESRNTGALRLGRFWARRARRLLPALALLLFGVAVYCVTLASSDELGTIRADALATIGYVANWRSIFAGNDYFALFRQPSPLNHTWSLAIEEQFYLVWPLIFFGLLAWKKAKAPIAVFVTAVGLAVTSSALMVWLYDAQSPSRSYYGTDTRAAAVLMGAALAAGLTLWGHVKAGSSRIALEIAGLIGAGLLAVLWFRLPGDAPRLYRGGFLIAGLSAIIVIAAAVHPQRGPIGWVLSFRPLCLLGLISYGLYLWHWPVDVVFGGHTSLTGWPLFVAETAVALGISIVSYRLVEMPIRRGAGNAHHWRVIVPGVTGALVAVLVIATAGATSPPSAAWTRRGQHGGVLLVGDSVARSLASGLVNVGIDVNGGTTAACRLVRGRLRFPAPNCPWPQIFTAGLDQANPKTALIVMGTWDMFDVVPHGNTQFVAPGNSVWGRVYAKELERAIALLGSRGARVVIPTIPCISAVAGTSAASRLAQGPLRIARVKAANEVIRSVAANHPGRVVVPDLFHFLCPTGRYQRSLDGVGIVCYDGEHYTGQGATLVAGWLKPWLTGGATP